MEYYLRLEEIAKHIRNQQQQATNTNFNSTSATSSIRDHLQRRSNPASYVMDNTCYPHLPKQTAPLAEFKEARHPKEEVGLASDNPNDSEQEDEDICPICTCIPPGKIFQCREGHIVCESCLQKIQENADRDNVQPKCPSCAGRLDNDTVSRVRVLENQLDRLTLDCCHKKNGCLIRLKRNEICTHESKCVYGQSLGICERLGFAKNCNFKLSPGNAYTVFQHIKSSHPSARFQISQFSESWNLVEAWEAVFEAKQPSKIFTTIAQAPRSQTLVVLIAQLSNDSVVSFCSVDLSLSLPVEDKLTVTFSISGESGARILWSIPVACGIDAWKFLSTENCRKPIEIGIHSLLQYCDQNGKLNFDVVVEPQRLLWFRP